MILRIHLNRAMINVKTKCQARADGMTIKSKWPKIEVPAILIDFEQCCNAPNDTRLPNFKWDDGMHLFKACKESLLWDASLKHPRIFLYPHRITCFSGKWHAGPMWSHFVCLQPTSRISVPPPHELNSFAARILELIRSPGVSDLCWIPKNQNPEKVRILATWKIQFQKIRRSKS